MKAALTILFLSYAVAGAWAQPPAPRTPDPTLSKVSSEFEAAVNAHDAARAASTYAQDATMFPAGQPAVHGRRAIREWYEQAFAQGLTSLALKPESSRISGPLGYEAGAYTVTLKSPSGESTTVEGRYVVVLERQGGHWHVIYDIDNTGTAPAAAKE
ncbi:MAG: nuclear transport factor 2 family protein [Acidobacteria bacterium]|nr:nuclear transport factor 2 family protein [Acidobacteriota bacterium]